MKTKWLLLAVIFILIASNSSALVLDLPNSITFFEEEKTLSFEVENQSGETQNLNVLIYSPIAYEIKGNKSFLKNGEKAFIEVTFLPNEKVLNSVYETTVLVELGREISQEKISMYFEKTMNYPDEKETGNKETEKDSDGANVFGALTGNVFLAGFSELFNPVNLILILIAAVLMLLFISRLTKRLTKGEKQ
ncbi:MAG: hypothetical protein COT90_03300 [Candidatus Diapherotrites archaeon CG10_big_fil_rev_8_21_14_0_10_31_34]|nr:MAG: hypothetical protein COT90_03300 [Candidatus Diapherotrites archaeon CG10_big_fil_rev_8_21_14_0_10_31_34]